MKQSECMSLSRNDEHFFPKEFEAIRKFLSENQSTYLSGFYELEISIEKSQYFFKCITMKYSDYRKIANLRLRAG